MHQIWKKKNKEETVLEFEVSDNRSNIPHIYELNIVNAETS